MMMILQPAILVALHNNAAVNKARAQGWRRHTSKRGSA